MYLENLLDLWLCLWCAALTTMEEEMKQEHLGYVLKDSRGRYYSSQHNNPVTKLGNCDVFPLGQARKIMRSYNKDGKHWNIVSVAIVEIGSV